MNTTIIAIHNSESLYEGIATTVDELLAMDSIKDSDLISNHQDSFLDDSFYKVLTFKLPTPYANDEDPNDTDNIYNNIQPGAYEDYDLSYLHK